MTHADIEAQYPKGHRLPRPIVDLCAFLILHGYPISGCFELSTDGMDALRAWFRDDSAPLDQLLPFGSGACGDIYALWLSGGLAPEHAPVVMFGSEGELEVLATDSEQFCRLLCLGYSEIGLDDPTTQPTDFDETAPFRQFMVQRYGFQLPATAAAIIDAARAAFPTFKTWVASRQP